MIIDIILAVIFISAIIYGINKGLLKVIARLLSTVIAFVSAYLLAEPVSKYIATQPFITDKVTPVINNFLSGALKEVGFLSRLQELISKGDLLVDSTFSTKIAEYIYVGLGFAVVFILVRILLWIVVMMLDNVLEMPVVNTINKIAGCIAAVILVYLEANIILAIIQLLGTFSFMDEFMQILNNSVIVNFIYEHNILMHVIIEKIL